MKFSINKNTLQNILAEHSKVVPIRTTLPVLSCAVFSIDKNTLTVKTSDLEQTIISENKIKEGKSGEIALPLGKLLEIVTVLPNEEITITVNEDLLVEINNNQGTYKITGRPSKEFPETPTPSKKENIQIQGEELLEIIKNTGYAVSRDDLKPALCGVYLNIEENQITTVSTDGHKLVKYIKQKQNTTTKTSLILPIKFLNILKDNIEKNNKINIFVGENHVLTQQKNTTIISRIIKENFPDFNSVIPEDNKIKIEVETQKIINCIKRVSIFSNKTTKQITLTFSSNGILVSAQDAETSTSAKEHLECVFEGEEITTSYNAKYLIEILQHQEDEVVEVYLKSALTAAVFLPKKQKTKTALVSLLMPMRLSQ